MNPYDVLAVPVSASEAQIKSAYRKVAKRTHPDNGGDGEAFAQASRAYAILMDPDARKKFDETGSLDELAPLTVRQRMIQLLATMFGDALKVEGQCGTSLKHFDLMNAMRQNMATGLNQARQNRDNFRKASADRTLLLKRITRTDDGENLFANIIRQQLQEIEPVLKQAELDVKAVEMAIDELHHYQSEVELIQAMQMAQFGGFFSGTTASSTQQIFVIR